MEEAGCSRSDYGGSRSWSSAAACRCTDRRAAGMCMEEAGSTDRTPRDRPGAGGAGRWGTGTARAGRSPGSTGGSNHNRHHNQARCRGTNAYCAIGGGNSACCFAPSPSREWHRSRSQGRTCAGSASAAARAWRARSTGSSARTSKGSSHQSNAYGASVPVPSPARPCLCDQTGHTGRTGRNHIGGRCESRLYIPITLVSQMKYTIIKTNIAAIYKKNRKTKCGNGSGK